MESNELLYLSRADVEAAQLDMAAIIRLLEQAFMEKGRGNVEMPPKPGIHTMSDAFIHAMPAYIPSLKSAGIKWVSGYPENYKRGLPYISGLLVLNDPETGIPYAVMDCTWITAYRTGAASALSATYLARAESETAAILACGVQGRTNLEALSCVFTLKKVYAYDILPDVQQQYVREMRDKLGMDIEAVKEPREAVENADLIVTSGPILKHPSPAIDRDWVRPGAFASAVDFDSYFSGAAMAPAMDVIRRYFISIRDGLGEARNGVFIFNESVVSLRDTLGTVLKTGAEVFVGLMTFAKDAATGVATARARPATRGRRPRGRPAVSAASARTTRAPRGRPCGAGSGAARGRRSCRTARAPRCRCGCTPSRACGRRRSARAPSSRPVRPCARRRAAARAGRERASARRRSRESARAPGPAGSGRGPG